MILYRLKERHGREVLLLVLLTAVKSTVKKGKVRRIREVRVSPVKMSQWCASEVREIQFIQLVNTFI